MDPQLGADLSRAGIALIVALLTFLTLRIRSRTSNDSLQDRADIASERSERSRLTKAGILQWLLPLIRKRHSRWSHSAQDPTGARRGKPPTKR
jgi:hypothetical protein